MLFLYKIKTFRSTKIKNTLSGKRKVTDFQGRSFNCSHRYSKWGPTDHLTWEIKFSSSFYAGIRGLQVILFRQGLWFAALCNPSVTPGSPVSQLRSLRGSSDMLEVTQSQERVRKRSNVLLTLNLSFHPLLYKKAKKYSGWEQWSIQRTLWDILYVSWTCFQDVTSKDEWVN